MSEQLDEGIAQVHRYDVRLCVADTPVLNHRLGQRVEGRKKGYMNAITERVWYECEGLLLIGTMENTCNRPSRSQNRDITNYHNKYK